MSTGIWTGPNALTAVRLACAPIVAGLIFWGDHSVFAVGPVAAAPWFWVAAGVFAAAAATDLVDGWWARKSGLVSPFGAALDHAADKVLVAAALIALAVTALAVDLVAAALIIVLRDLAAGGLREGLALSGARLPVSGPGKVKTATEMLGVVALLAAQAFALGDGAGMALTALELAARALIWMAAALALYTLAEYLSVAIRSGQNRPS